MKLVVAIIKPSRLEDVRQALSDIEVQGMSVTEVRGYGRQKGHTETYRGAEYSVSFLPKLKLEIAVDDPQLDAVTAAVRSAAESSKIGDGKMFVFDLKGATRIRTGETGVAAL
ncbi:MAG: P-II family nitrogen regulator [Hyphomicrobiaceae bacterium]|nr:P-II family nitrogen regulator [Hyphomicrobiaceae bacterium]